MERLLSYLDLVLAYTSNEKSPRNGEKRFRDGGRAVLGPASPIKQESYPFDSQSSVEAAIVYLARRVTG